MPHLALTAEQIAGCFAAKVPSPPTGAVQFDLNAFDWRNPGEGECGPQTPTSFRWRFERHGRLKVFCAYGWHQRQLGYGRTKMDPEWGYSLLPGELREAAVLTEFGED